MWTLNNCDINILWVIANTRYKYTDHVLLICDERNDNNYEQEHRKCDE